MKPRSVIAWWSCSICVLMLLSYEACVAQASVLDVGGHTKYRGTFYCVSRRQFLSDSNWAPVAEDFGFDARLNLAWRANGWDLLADAQFGAFYGDSIELTRGFGEQLQALYPRLPSDDRRLFDLTQINEDEAKLAAVSRLDRFSVGYTGDNGVLRLGRQAVTWGNGLIFNTVMDIFNPFDPTAIDKEYKSGDDILYGQYLRDNGDDFQVLRSFVGIPRPEMWKRIRVPLLRNTMALSGSANLISCWRSISARP